MIVPSHKRKDGTWNVVIRVTHERVVRYVSTSMYVSKADITKAYKIKNAQIIDRCEDIIATFRKKCLAINLDACTLTTDELVRYLKRKDDGTSPSFTQFALQWIEESDCKGKKNYMAALHSLQRCLGRDEIRFSDIDCKVMQVYEKSLADKRRAQSLYTHAIVRMFGEGRLAYNNEDAGIIVVKHSLSRYHAPKQRVASRKRALTLEQIRAIFALPYDNIVVKGKSSRHDIALDCFRLSFALMGMNAVDLYNATEMRGHLIIYNRTKTRDRRNDEAEMQVAIPDCIRALVDKYKGNDGHVFCFASRYSTPTEFNRNINLGLKKVGEEIGVDNLQFYAARHSMATIAVNDCRISKYIVNDMLCHVDSSLRITELYIKKDYTVINEANAKLLEYVLGKRH